MEEGFPHLHLVTDDWVLSHPEFLAQARSAMEAGGPRLALHLRGPGTSGRRLHDLGVELLAYRKTGALLLVNDRVDLALTLGADGVHLPGHGLPPAVARRMLGPGPLLGRSLHGWEEWEGLNPPDREGLRYLFVGTLFATPSHPNRTGAGTNLLREMKERARSHPLVGIGGVTPERVSEVRGAGAMGVAVIRGIWNAPDPAAAVAAYLRAWTDPPPPSGV